MDYCVTLPEPQHVLDRFAIRQTAIIETMICDDIETRFTPVKCDASERQHVQLDRII